MYLDGSEVSLNTHSNSLNTTTKNAAAHFYVGKMLITPYSPGGGLWNSGTTFFRGKIDEVAVFEKALTSTEVLAIYNTSTYSEWELLTTTTGDTYVDTGATVGYDYSWRVRGFSDCFDPTIIYTPWSEDYDILLPTVTTDSITNIDIETATANATVVTSGSTEITARGICISETGTPTTGDTTFSITGETGAFYADLTGLSENTFYYVRAYAANDNGISYGNQLTFTTTYDILPVINLAASGITCTGGTITWTNPNPSGITEIYVKEFNGVSYVTIDTISSGATSYVLTGLTPNTYNNYIITTTNGVLEDDSVNIEVKTLDATPFNLTGTTHYNNATITWEINDPAYGTAIIPQYCVYGESEWQSGTTLAKNATGYTFTNLSYDTIYEVRIVRLGSEYIQQHIHLLLVEL